MLRSLPGSPPPSPTRSESRRSLLYFGHLTDLHVTDEASPLRTELVDPAPVGDYAYNAAWRPQEVMSAQAADRSVRAMNARRVSPVLQGDGSAAEMSLALVTGDLIDNLQHNEMEAAATLLAGGRLDPHSGVVPSATAPCAGAPPDVLERLRAWANARAYVGVQRFGLFPRNAPANRAAAFYDPSQPRVDTEHPDFPRYDLPRVPGLLERSQQRFGVAGLRVPYWVARGNHGTLVQGFYTPWSLEALYQLSSRGLGVTGCRKIFPGAAFDPYAPPFGPGPIDQGAIIAAMQKLYAEAAEGRVDVFRWVPPDPRRRHFDSPDFPGYFADATDQAGFRCIDAGEREASAGFAHYYAAVPRPGLRMISLDTNATQSGPDGHLSAPQFAWLARELASVPPDELVILFGHHSLETLDNTTPDECPTGMTGCQEDPRSSTPVRLGCPTEGAALDCDAPFDRSASPDNLRDLLLAHPQVVLYVSGHTHEHRIDPFPSGDGTGFWQVTTASIVDWPQEARTLELMDNGDGTLSIFGTVAPLLGDLELPVPIMPAPDWDHAQVLAMARNLAAGDVQWREGPGREAAGRSVDGVAIDRDVELTLRDPRPAGASRGAVPEEEWDPCPQREEGGSK